MNASSECRRLLAIYTGGTFGMLKNDKGVLVPQKDIEAVIRRLPQLHDAAYWKQHLEVDEDSKDYLVLPDGKDTTMKVFYKILEYEELKDSSDFNVDDWIKMARDIKKYYDEYDGFVVLHGTDTTAYGASALSFMLESIGKTVVLTGAQVPIFQPRSDGLNNFLSALLIAATHHIPEVTVFFGAKLFRGNRLSIGTEKSFKEYFQKVPDSNPDQDRIDLVKKVSNTRIYGFDSPNYPALLEAKSTLEWDPHGPPSELPKARDCTLHDQLCRNVYVLKVAPTITGDIIKAICRPPIEGDVSQTSIRPGVILETLGNGNMPIKRREIYDELRAAVRSGIIIVNVTQCINGTVLSKPLYETGRLVAECGVVPAYDMTQEAAMAKLAYVLTKKELTYDQKVQVGLPRMYAVTGPNRYT
ncbi:L-asparaginase [Eumeta japonica]|uniref:asparaginase n=1 Tax=Eumeta variegata TaxID=151549 RepID=A0A4C1W1T0_EUMVA|nr:L-asparaginase [Eumeta japonica]